MAGAQLVLLALRFLRLHRRPTASSCTAPRGCCRRCSPAALVAARRAARARRRSRCRCSSPADRSARPALRARRVARCWRSPREILGRYLFFVSVVPKHLAAPYMALGKRGRMTLKRLLGLDTQRRALRLRRRSGGRLHLGAEDRRPLGGDHLRLLLGRLRHVHRRQGRPRRQRARQSGSSGEPRHAVPEGTVRAPHASTPTTARAIRCCAAATAGSAASAGTRRSTTMAARFRDVQARHGPDAVGVISTGQLVTEEFYALGKLVQLGLGTPQLRRQHDAVHVHRGVGLQAVVRQRRPARRLRGPRARRRHPADRRQHRREPSDPVPAAARPIPAPR